MMRAAALAANCCCPALLEVMRDLVLIRETDAGICVIAIRNGHLLKLPHRVCCSALHAYVLDVHALPGGGAGDLPQWGCLSGGALSQLSTLHVASVHLSMSLLPTRLQYTRLPHLLLALRVATPLLAERSGTMQSIALRTSLYTWGMAASRVCMPA